MFLRSDDAYGFSSVIKSTSSLQSISWVDGETEDACYADLYSHEEVDTERKEESSSVETLDGYKVSKKFESRYGSKHRRY